MGFLTCKSWHHGVMRSKKTSVVLVAVGLLVGGCSGSSAPDEPTEEELASEVAEEPEVVVTTTTVPPTTTEAPTTTVAPTTTAVTTTTIDPIEMAVVNQIVAMTYMANGDPQGDGVRDSIIAIADSLVGSFGRVDVVAAEVSDETGVRLVVEAISGFSSTAIKQEEAAEFLNKFAGALWVPEGFGNILDNGNGGVDFDFTMDGQNWVIPAQTMMDIVARRTSAQAVLGF